MSVYPCRWDGVGFTPLIHVKKRADTELGVGEVYFLALVEDRSMVSHKHQFAWLKHAWALLPETIAYLYPTPEHLRKRALIEAGYFTEEVIDAGGSAAALRVAAYVQSKDIFTHVVVRKRFVLVRHAESQSMAVMKKRRFQESKDAIMVVIANMIGVPVDDLERMTRYEPA
jgi:hypothetical protein